MKYEMIRDYLCKRCKKNFVSDSGYLCCECEDTPSHLTRGDDKNAIAKPMKIDLIKSKCKNCGADAIAHLDFCWKCHEELSNEYRKYTVPIEPEPVYYCIFCDAETTTGREICNSCKDTFLQMKYGYNK